MSRTRTLRIGALARGGLAAAATMTVALAGGAQAFAATHPAAAGTISTTAGGVGGPGLATDVTFGTDAVGPCGVSARSSNLFIADDMTVREVAQKSGQLTTPAGTAASGPAGDGGASASASFSTCAAASDAKGNIAIADTASNEVRLAVAVSGTYFGQAMTAGNIYDVAGVTSPASLAEDAKGNLVVANPVANLIQVIAIRNGTFYGQTMKAGQVYPVAGTGTKGFFGDGGPAVKARMRGPDAVAVDASGNLLITDAGNQRVRVVAESTASFYGQPMTAGDIYTVAGNGTGGFAGDGGVATSAQINDPTGLATDSSGNLIVADSANQRVRVVAASTATFYGQSMTTGDIYTVAGNGTAGYTGDGSAATAAELDDPAGVAVDNAGNLVIADEANYAVRVVAGSTAKFYAQPMTAGSIYTVAGQGPSRSSGYGGPATQAEFATPAGVAVDAAGDQFTVHGGRVLAVAAAAGTIYGVTAAAGHVYPVAGTGSLGFSGDGGPAHLAEFGNPAGLAVDGNGNLVIADTGNNRVRVVAAAAGTFYGQVMKANHVYTVAGNGTAGFAGDGGVATSAQINAPGGVAVDGNGNLVIADTGNNRVRVVAVAAGTFYGRTMKAGHIYTVAGNGTAGYTGNGGAATSAEINAPVAVAVDGASDLAIADTGNSAVRVVAAAAGTLFGQSVQAGHLYTVAGNGTAGSGGDGGLGTSALLNAPQGIAVDGSGNLLIADTNNMQVRVVAAAAGTFYGQPMTTGDIYAVAGTGTQGFAGDGGPGASAELSKPRGVAASGGSIVIIDTNNDRIRVVSG